MPQFFKRSVDLPGDVRITTFGKITEKRCVLIMERNHNGYTHYSIIDEPEYNEKASPNLNAINRLKDPKQAITAAEFDACRLRLMYYASSF